MWPSHAPRKTCLSPIRSSSLIGPPAVYYLNPRDLSMRSRRGFWKPGHWLKRVKIYHSVRSAISVKSVMFVWTVHFIESFDGHNRQNGLNGPNRSFTLQTQ